MAVVDIKGIKIGEGLPKICVPLVGNTEEELIMQAISAQNSFCDMVEVRIDYFKEIRDFGKVNRVLAKLKEKLSKPLLLTFRTLEEGGEQSLLKEEYSKLYESVLAKGLVDAIDLELFIGEDILTPLIKSARQKGIQVILSNHEFTRTPPAKEIIERLLRMQKNEADIVKIAVMPQSKQDVLRLLEATVYVKENYDTTPVVAISMGSMGLPSRILGEFTGSAITFGVLNQASAPGQLSVQKLYEILHALQD